MTDYEYTNLSPEFKETPLYKAAEAFFVEHKTRNWFSDTPVSNEPVSNEPVSNEPVSSVNAGDVNPDRIGQVKCDAHVGSYRFNVRLQRSLVAINNKTHIVPLTQVIEDLLLFFVAELAPYLCRQHHSTLINRARWNPVHERLPSPAQLQNTYFFRLIESLVYSIPAAGMPIESNFLDRWKAGLVRRELLQLVEVVLRGHIRTLRSMMENGAGYDELCDESTYSVYHCMRSFWLSNRFRSERTELLILKYLGEDGMNRKVVRGVDLATSDFRNAQRWIQQWVDIDDQTKTSVALLQSRVLERNPTLRGFGLHPFHLRRLFNCPICSR
ncbi:hypothetical protein BJ508DRAFT_380283 [Ascobolus immersus RN42]|uniref:Uncharacterized protein n=1 Tax=Ascobolus immersus RN42 TaxID=1160509 RepID=A0A3N4HMJ3_ASCIM|nr:hypothetical protein BJ508DRAFT_380283 [Ascobolus immersus RN42]